MEDVGIFFVHLVYFTTICHILLYILYIPWLFGIFSQFWCAVARKTWQPWCTTVTYLPTYVQILKLHWNDCERPACFTLLAPTCVAISCSDFRTLRHLIQFDSFLEPLLKHRRNSFRAKKKQKQKQKNVSYLLVRPCDQREFLLQMIIQASRFHTGWPDWSNFRQLGPCLLWVFFENCWTLTVFWANFSKSKVMY
jgi:hypothetical protein